VAERILSGRASEFSHKKALWQLDVTKLSAGSGMYGALESKISSLAAELDEDGDVILVIPNLHTTVGAGGKEGTVDIANLLKPIFANPNVPVIGICTQAEYKKYLEKDSSLVNLFETIRIEEPPEEETRKMIVRSLESIEEHHLVKIDFAAVDETINLCKRFLPYRKFPEKAFDVLDITCARKKNAAYVAPEELILLEESVWDKIEDYAAQGLMLEKGSPEYEKISKLETKVAKKYQKWSENLVKNVPRVSAEDVVSTFVEKFKITENLINQSQNELTSDLADRIRQEVFGQDQAVEAVCDVLVCSKAGLRDRTKPLAKFLFVGSSGVGKTLLGKKIAKYYFGDEKALLKLDMSEFQEKHSISSLTGAPPGYIGFDNGGKLTEYVKNNPSCVVLFDEIEKAHPDIANLLLQIMDDGCLTDSAGYRVDFTNTVIIITGNIGSGERKTTMGFLNQMEEGENYKIALKKHFRPEFLNRLDDPIVFNELDEKTMTQILWDSLNTTIKNAAKQKITLTVDQSLVDYLLKQAKTQDTHARNIQKLVEKTLNIPLSKRILKDKPKEIVAKIVENKLELV
jgi:ATP-dependent Clp protease ATP-binding subunit ClpC